MHQSVLLNVCKKQWKMIAVEIGMNVIQKGLAIKKQEATNCN